LDVALGIWPGTYQNLELPWLRWWDSQGNLLLTGAERAELERERAELERERAELEKQKAERYAQKLRELGINPEDI
jgi:hypothetical protein